MAPTDRIDLIDSYEIQRRADWASFWKPRMERMVQEYRKLIKREQDLATKHRYMKLKEDLEQRISLGFQWY